MCFSFNQDGLVPALEDMADPVVVPVEFLGIDTIELTHSFTEGAINGFDDNVVMVAHEAIGMTKPIEEIAAPCEDIKEDSTILVIAENIFLFIPTRGDMIKCSRKFYA